MDQISTFCRPCVHEKVCNKIKTNLSKKKLSQYSETTYIAASKKKNVFCISIVFYINYLRYLLLLNSGNILLKLCENNIVVRIHSVKIVKYKHKKNFNETYSAFFSSSEIKNTYKFAFENIYKYIEP